MTDHDTAVADAAPGAPDPDDALSAADVDRAFGTAVIRGRSLVRRRHRVGLALGGVGIVAVLVGSFGLVRALGDDEPGVEVGVGVPGIAAEPNTEPNAETTTSPPTTAAPSELPLAPDGYLATALPDGSVALQNAGPPIEAPTVSFPDGVEIGGGLATERAVAVASGEVVSPQVMRVRFVCLRGNDRIDTVRYRLDSSTVTVDAAITGGGAAAPGCGPDDGATIELRFPAGDLPADAVAVAAPLTP